MSNGQIVKRTDAVNTLREMLEKSKPQMAMALPKSITPDRFFRVVMTAVQTTPKLLECDRRSLLAAVMTSAQLGLEPGPLGHAYLIPYGDKVQFIPGYRGMIDLARRSGQIDTIQAHVVYDGDAFQVAFGLNPVLQHTPKMDGERGNPWVVYAIAKLNGGGTQFEVMTVREVEAVRSRSKAAKSGPWVTDWEEMARKTVVRRLFKYLPVSVEMSRAVTLDEQAAANIPQELEPLEIEGETVEVAEERTALDVLAESHE